MIRFVNLAEQYSNIRPEIDKAVFRVFGSNSYILGDEVRNFEKEFAFYCGAKYAVGVGSGTEAIHLALTAIGVRKGDKVLTAPNTAVPTVSAISASGAEPIFIDIDPETHTMSAEALEKKLRKNFSDKIKAIIPVHLYGHPADMIPIIGIARRYGIKVIEDACQAHGAEYKEKKAGAIGDMGCFSFYPTKNLGSYGDGGIILTDNKGSAEKLYMLRNYGEQKKNHNVIKGFNSRLDEIHAAILRVKLKYLDKWNARRIELAGLYDELFKGVEIKTPLVKKYAKHVFHLYVIRTKRRDELKDFLEEKGILTNIHYPKLVPFQKAYRYLKYKEKDLPNAARVNKEILSLPIYPELTALEAQEVAKAVGEFCR